MKSEFRRVDSNYDADNPLLFVALGMVSALATLERLCDEHAPPKVESEAPALNDDAAYFVLGLLAFKRRLVGALAKPCAADAPPAHEVLSTSTQGSLLR